MKFLIDQNLSTRLCTYLDDAGHEAVHVKELSLSMAEDVEILERARTDGLVIISSDRLRHALGRTARFVTVRGVDA